MYQYIDVGSRTSTDDTGLLPGQSYSFNVSVNNGTSTVIQFTTPSAGGSGTGGQILYGDLCHAINTGSTAWGMSGVNPMPGGALMVITDLTGGTFPTITGSMTYGYLKVVSPTSGSSSKISLVGNATNSLLASLNSPLGATLLTAVSGTSAGLQNSPTSYTQERERLLSHLIFSPVLKSANRTLAITYTLTISVARS